MNALDILERIAFLVVSPREPGTKPISVRKRDMDVTSSRNTGIDRAVIYLLSCLGLVTHPES